MDELPEDQQLGEEHNEGEQEEELGFEDAFDGDVPALDPNDVRSPLCTRVLDPEKKGCTAREQRT